MDDDFSDIHSRQDRLEGHVAHLEERVDLEAGLRATMDRDLGDISVKLGAQQKLLKALADVQSDHTQRLTRIEDDVTVLTTDVKTLKTDVRTLRSDVGTVKSDVTTLKSDVTTLKTDVGTLKSDVGTLKGDMGTVKVGVHAILELLSANPAGGD